MKYKNIIIAFIAVAIIVTSFLFCKRTDTVVTKEVGSVNLKDSVN